MYTRTLNMNKSTNGQSKNIEIPGPGCRQVQNTNIQKYKLQIKSILDRYT